MKIYPLIRPVLFRLPYPILRLYFLRKARKLKATYYLNDSSGSSNNYIVSVINENIKSGGLSDRINGIISTYHSASLTKRPFKLWFKAPFDLELFLVPNEIDWHIEESEIVWNKQQKVIVERPIRKDTVLRQIDDMINIIQKNEDTQIHVYSNLWIRNNELFHLYFNKLFKPSKQLQERIDKELRQIGCEYVSITYRFQQLLGDFSEGNYPTLDEEGKEQIMEESIGRLIDLHARYPEKKILVTSDSKTFLDKIRQFDYTYVIDGELVHMDYNTSSDFETHVKSFVDLFMISNAEIIYSVVAAPLYDSGFPKFAAQINNKPIRFIE